MAYPNSFLKVVTPIAFAIALASCGGGGSSFGAKGDSSGGSSGGGDSGGDGGTVAKVAANLVLSTNSRRLETDGVNPIIITAIAKDENNVAIPDATITIATTDQEATLTTPAKSGAVTTSNLTSDNKANRAITITATSGTKSKSIVIDVIGTDIKINGPESITFNKSINYVLKLEDSADKPISHQVVTITSSAGNTINDTASTVSIETNESGEIAFTLKGAVGGPGADTLTATALGKTVTKEIAISNDDFQLSTASGLNEVNINTAETINFVWKNGGAAQAGKTITFSATRGSIAPNPATVVTNAAGEASITITSPTAGQTVISATSDSGLSTSLTREFVATTPSIINTQADPILIAPNTTSTIVTRILDADHNPVKNKIIDFNLNDTVSGSLSASTAKTDSFGRASVSYTAGDTASATDGVHITSTVQGFPLLTDSVDLTVGGTGNRITLGYDNLLEKRDVYYKKQFGVIVTDSAGKPIKNKTISISIDPLRYFKGVMQFDAVATVWSPNYSVPGGCVNEDFNRNGILDVAEDTNTDGNLWPTHDATVVGSGVTDDKGELVVVVEYPKNTALWSEQRITASFIADGTEFITHADFILPIMYEDVSDAAPPPNLESPYGKANVCTDPN